mgnify:CR=1 FL=1
MRALALEVLVLAGFGALALVGGPLPAVALLGAAATVLGALVPARFRERIPWTPMAIGALAGIGGQLWLGALPVEALGSLLAILQIHRRAGRRLEDDDRVAVVLAGLMVVSAAGVSRDPLFLLCALTFGLALPLAMLPRGAGETRRPSGAGWSWLPVHGLLSVVVFLTLPRPVQPGGDTASARLTGFSPDVELGELDPLLDDPSVVLRAQVDGPGLPDPPYWRGIALDGFDGKRWYSTTPPTAATLAPGRGVDVTVELGSVAEGVLFVPGRAVALSVDGLRADRQGGWFVPPAAEGLTYVVSVVPVGDGGELGPENDPSSRWLQLPALDSGVFELAREVAGEGTDREQVERLAAWLRTETTYTRAGQRDPERPLEDYLLRQREGHCELVAAGLAVMGRAVDVPTRVVNGFVGADRDPVTGELVVRRRHAHSWTEVLLDGHWVIVDATPEVVAPAPPTGLAAVAAAGAAWRDAAGHWFEGSVIGFDRHLQRDTIVDAAAALEGLAPVQLPGHVPWLGLAVLGLLASLLLWGLRRGLGWLVHTVADPVDPSRRGPVAKQWQRARAALVEAGVPLPVDRPPLAATEAVASELPSDVLEALQALCWLHYDVALGGADADSLAPRAESLADAVVQGLRRHGTEGP